jgi:hypothetical protein
MTPIDEYPTKSEIRIVASSEDGKARIESALREVESHTSRMPPSPTARRLKLEVEVCQRILDSWTTRTPTDEELAVLGEQVAEALQAARRNSPTVRLRRSG